MTRRAETGRGTRAPGGASRWLVALALGLGLSCSLAHPPGTSPERGAPAEGGGDGAAVGLAGAVATAHPLATEIALEVLGGGGNAADAAVAAAFALAVVEPYSSGLGGGGFVLHRVAGSDAVRVLDFRERAPHRAHPGLFLVDGEADAALSRESGLAVGVPGFVAGMAAIADRFGTRSLAEGIAPAERLAREGFAVDERLAERIDAHLGRMRPRAEAEAVFAPDGAPAAEGDVLRQPGLARALRAIAAGGPGAFHGGALGRDLVGAVAAAGGILDATDLEAYRVREREPVEGTYRGVRVVSMPPPSSGGVHLVQMLAVLERLGVHELERDDPLRLHLLAETMRRAYADRSVHLGDPDFYPVPVAALLSGERIGAFAAGVDPAHATPSTELRPRVLPGAAAGEGVDTTHLSIADGDGNLVSMTLTINTSFGSGLLVPGWGIVLNNEMDDFASQPGVPNAYGLVGGRANQVEAGKTPLSSMSPSILFRDGQPLAVVGSPGGSRIITTVLQVVLDLIDGGLEPAAAVAAPRVHHQWTPDVLHLERGGFDAATRRALERRGHEVREGGPWCNVQLVVRSGEGWVGASDPRGVGRAAPAAASAAAVGAER